MTYTLLSFDRLTQDDKPLMKQFIFYLRYALRNIQRGGRWTTMAVFSIAAGVAAVVALRGLGLAIGDTLLRDVRADLKGDVILIKGEDNGPQLFNISDEGVIYFSDTEIQAVTDYVNERGGVVTEFNRAGNLQVVPVRADGDTENTGSEVGGIGGLRFGTASFIELYLIDPQTYPPTHDIIAIEPRDTPLTELFTGGNEVVISSNMAETQNIGVGDFVRVAQTEELFTVVGIISADEESSLRNIFASFFGFAYMDLSVAQQAIDPELGINRLSIFLDEPLSANNVDAVREALIERATLTNDIIDFDTAPALLERNAIISEVLQQFIVVMGLGALLIGGVGIMNTMLVLVRRRSMEIASLKTFGLKGGQIGWLFLVEGLILGIIGSIIGCVIGVLLGGLVNQYGEQFIQQSLAWRIYPEALLYGFVLGIVTTGIFSFIPIANALEVRPGIILRPNDANKAARVGILRSIALLIIVTVLVGFVVGRIITPLFTLAAENSTFAYCQTVSLAGNSCAYLSGIVGTAITFLVLGILLFFFWLLMWLVGRFPAFGSVDLRLALRNLRANRLRTATTLLALSAGMFALSIITFVGEGTREILNLQLSNQFGGNVLAFPIAGQEGGFLGNLAETNINRAVADVPGINSRTVISNYEIDLTQINGEPITIPELDENFDFSNGELREETFAYYELDDITSWRSDNPNNYEAIVVIDRGRNLTLADNGQRVTIVPSSTAEILEIGVGTTLSYRTNNGEVTYEVVGLYSSPSGVEGGVGIGGPIVPPDSIGVSAEFQLYAFDVEEEYTGQAVAELSSVVIPPVFALNVSFVDSLLSRFIDTFAALPTVVGILSLLAAAVIMANTVALATLERRQQIGILKAIGLKSRRVLVIMLIETTIIGLLSAGIGLGLSWLIIEILGRVTDTPIPVPRSAQIVALSLVLAAVAISWIATFLSANVAVRERVMNVLRYE